MKVQNSLIGAHFPETIANSSAIPLFFLFSCNLSSNFPLPDTYHVISHCASFGVVAQLLAGHSEHSLNELLCYIWWVQDCYTLCLYFEAER